MKIIADDQRSKIEELGVAIAACRTPHFVNGARKAHFGSTYLLGLRPLADHDISLT